MTHERHVAPYGAARHRADRRCQCGPVAIVDLNEPSVPTFVHRRPPPLTEAPPGGIGYELTARRRRGDDA